MNYKQVCKGSLIFAFLILTPVTYGAGLTALQVMEKNEEVRQLHDLNAGALLETGSGSQVEKIKTFKWWKKLQKDGIHFSTLTRFLKPAEVKNEAILFLENTGGLNDVFLYLPTYKKVRRVESQQQSGSFMGSDLSYSDMATPHVMDYDYKLLTEEKCPESDSANVSCYVVHSKPKTDEIRKRTGFQRVKSGFVLIIL